MRTTLLLLAALWLSPLLWAQDAIEKPTERKTVTIVQTWTDDQGRERTMTIIKEGDPHQDNQAWFESDLAEAPADAATSREVEIRLLEVNPADTPGRQRPWVTLSEDIRRGLPDMERYLQDVGVELQEIGGELGLTLSGPAFLGVVTKPSETGALITEVVDSSPAAQAGLQPGDVLTHLGDQALRNQQDLVRALRGRKPGDTVTLHWIRDGQAMAAEAILDQRRTRQMQGQSQPRNHQERIMIFRDAPRQQKDQSAWLGIRMEEHRDGIRVSQVIRNSPARAVGLVPGDILNRIDRKGIATPNDLVNYLKDKKEGDQVVLHLRREGRKVEVPVVLGDRSGCCLPSECPPGCCEEMGLDPDEIRLERPDPASPGNLQLPDLRIYPNPTSGLVRIAFRTPSEGEFTIRVLDPQGKVLLEHERNGSDRFDEELDLQAYPAGNYTLFIEQDGQFLSRTIIRNR